MSLMGFGGMFGQMDRMMNQMDEMMNSMMGAQMGANPFPMMNSFGAGGLGAPHHSLLAPAIDPFSMMNQMHSQVNMMNPLGGGGMMMQQMMNNPNGMCYSSSSVTTITSDGAGRPQVRQHTNSSRNIGGLRETKETLKDTRTGVQKMSLGRHIQDKGHVMHRQRNVYEGTEVASDDFINIADDQVESFDSEWQQRARGLGADRRAPQIQEITEGDYNDYSRSNRLALPPCSNHSEPEPSGPIIEEVDDDDEIVNEVSSARSTPSATAARFRELPPSPHSSRYGKHARSGPASSYHGRSMSTAPTSSYSPTQSRHRGQSNSSPVPGKAKSKKRQQRPK